ncbi:MAG: MFS transporter [Pseudomonadota bacterium]
MEKPTRKLSLPVMTAFGVGQAAEGMKNAAFGTFLLFYYQQVVGVSGTLTGIALAIALCFDAVTDPLAGALSDRLRTRWGRRHPFMLIAAAPMGASLFFLFNPPAGMSEFQNFLWLMAFAIFLRGSLTFYHIPHLALGAEMAHNYNQRSVLFAFSTFFGYFGGAMTSFIAYAFLFPTTEEYNPGLLNPDGYFGFGVIFGLGMAITIVLCVFGTAKEIPHLRTPPPSQPFSARQLLKELLEAFRNPSFRSFFFGLLFSTLVLSIEGVFSPFMGVHFWGLTTEQLKYLPLAALLGLFFSIPLTPIFTRWLDKKPTLLTLAAVAILNANVLIVLRLLEVDWFPDNSSPAILWMILMTTFISTALGPIIFSSLNSMFADIADEHELETGERREGIIYSARACAINATVALGVFIGGILLDFIAFPRGAKSGTVDPETIWNLGFIQGPATSIFTLLGIVLYLGYKLDRKRHAEITAELERRQRLREEGAT